MTNDPTTRQTTTTRRTTMGPRLPPQPILVSDQQVADSLNKRTVGIKQYSDITDIQRIKKQNELNRQLVEAGQQQLRQRMGLDPTPNGQPRTDAMTTDQVQAGSEAAEDHVQIGDTSYNINVGNPEQLQAVLDHLKTLKPTNGNQPQQPQQPEGPVRFEPPVNTVITQPGEPVQVNPQPQPQPQPQPVQQAPPPKTLGEKILPWALAAATGLGAAGLTYGLTRPETGPDTDTTYRLEFDEGEAPGQTIPVPRLQE